MLQEDIIFCELSNIGIVTLNRPKALNALSQDMILKLYHQLAKWKKDDQTKVIVIQGEGEKAFCAGGDIRKVYEARHDQELAIKHFFWDEYRLNDRIHHYQKPYVSLLDGITMGGGVGVSIHGSHRIVTERFLFAMPETGIGFFPDVGGSYFLSRCPGQTGIYLGLTGERIKAADAIYLGLADNFVSVERIAELFDTLASNNLGSDVKSAVTQVIEEASSPAGDPPLAQHREEIDACFGFTTMEEILAALKQRNNEWSHKTTELLLTKSPTSLKVTLEQIHRGKNQSFDECMRMEYRLVNRFLKGHDFYEGVRALIVDKDQKPFWQPSELSAITARAIDAYFAPLTDTPELEFK